MAPISPRFEIPAFSPMQGGDRSYTGFLEAADLFAPLPLTVTTAVSIETPPIYVQGFNQFQGWLSAAGAGTLLIQYGICYPVAPFNVIGYRTLFPSAAPGASMFATFGQRGQAVPAFQGDLFTLVTLKITAATLTVTINNAAMWFAGG